MIIWGSLVVMICGMLVILGLNLEDNKIERELRRAANHYIENNNIKLSMASATIIYVKELVKDEYIKELLCKIKVLEKENEELKKQINK